ncbi:MAG: APC family permease [Solirubrobacteraceae bacterium]
MSTATPTAQPRLRRGALGFPQLLAQSVALISPTMTAVLIIPLAFSNAGKSTWAAYAFGTVMLLFVVFGLNQFAKRSTTAGSMYAYTGRGLGPSAGVLSGWSLIWCYLFIGVAGMAGFAVFCQQFLEAVGIGGSVSPFIWFLLSGALCFTVAWKDIKFSSTLTLVLEGLSVACILILAVIILFGHGFSVDTNQIKLKGISFRGMDFAIVVCIFSLVGFESATALGGEAKRPFKDVPRAVIWSLIATGLFMIVMSYVEVYGTRNMHSPLNSLSAPLNTLADAYSVGFFKTPVSLGAMISFFGLSLSCLNAGARIIMPLGGHGFLPKQLHQTHSRNLTPHAAILVFIIAIAGVPIVMHGFGTDPLTIFNDAGTLAAFGFLFAYFLITIAAPVYLRKIGELKPKNIAIAVAAFACLWVPLIGSFYPAPPYPVKLFPYMFAAWAILGGAWLFIVNKRAPGTLSQIEADLESTLDASIHHDYSHDAGTEPLDLGGMPVPAPA